ncbi:MAG TPA: hypothetical protein VED01_05940 [Burkholderiales bacterium]|nr:hypothetical protein [Burkholderiales bacterium]
MRRSITFVHAALMTIVLAASSLAAAADVLQSGESDRGTEVQPPPQRITPKPRVTPTSDRCDTIYVNCILSERQPRGSQCWCVTPFGSSYGRVR